MVGRSITNALFVILLGHNTKYSVDRYGSSNDHAVDSGIEPLSRQANDYEIGICCISAKHATFKSKSKNL
jgi:hypothetical protein